MPSEIYLDTAIRRLTPMRKARNFLRRGPVELAGTLSGWAMTKHEVALRTRRNPDYRVCEDNCAGREIVSSIEYELLDDDGRPTGTIEDKLEYREARRLHEAGLVRVDIGHRTSQEDLQVALKVLTWRSLPSAKRILKRRHFELKVDRQRALEIPFTWQDLHIELVDSLSFNRGAWLSAGIAGRILLALGIVGGVTLGIVSPHTFLSFLPNEDGMGTFDWLWGGCGLVLGMVGGRLIPAALDWGLNLGINYHDRTVAQDLLEDDYGCLRKFICADSASTKDASVVLDLLLRFYNSAAIAGYLSELPELQRDVLLDQLIKSDSLGKKDKAKIGKMVIAHPNFSCAQKMRLVDEGGLSDHKALLRLARDEKLPSATIARLICRATRRRIPHGGDESEAGYSDRVCRRAAQVIRAHAESRWDEILAEIGKQKLELSGYLRLKLSPRG
ncbi:MAG: hypothetical protein HQ596_02365 [Candidatus Saganbacteria bacterium]|nr:hypothetical protein [Candidatus Saganbacteria bacterium]